MVKDLPPKTLRTESLDKIKKLAKKYGLKVVLLFGSHARGTSLPTSDIDLAVLPTNPNFYKEKFSDFQYDLMEVENLEKKTIDVVPISNYNPILLFHIFNDGVPLYIKDPTDYARLCNWARFSYEDNQRFFYGREEAIKQQLAQL